MAAAGTAAKAAGAVAAGGGPEDPIGDAAAAGIVAKDAVASKGAQEGAKDTASKVAKDAPDVSGGKPDKSGGKPDTKKPAPGSKGKQSRARRAVGFAFSGNRRVLTGQFIACVLVVILGTLLAPEGSKDSPMRALVKASSLCAVYFLLALLATGGGGAAKAATAIGTLVAASYLLTSSDVHNVVTWIADFFKKPDGPAVPAATEGEQ